MANDIIPTDLIRLENFFHHAVSVYVIDNIRKDVFDFERRQQEAALKMEQKRQSEDNIKRVNEEIEELNVK